MKKTFLLSLFFVAISGWAQVDPSENQEIRQKPTPEQREAMRGKRLAKELNLTPGQQKEMQLLMQEVKSKKEANKMDNKANKSASLEDRKEKTNKMFDEKIMMRDRVKKILTPEQFTKWEKLKEERKEKHPFKPNHEKQE